MVHLQNETNKVVSTLPKAKNNLADEACALYVQGLLLKDIAEKLGVPASTVRRWKSTYKWDSECSDKITSVRKKGAPLNNANAAGNTGGKAPKKNNNAVKHGIFQKYLPEESMDIIESMTDNPLDVLWGQIQIAYAAIVRAQKIMYVKDIDDCTTTQIGHKDGDNVTEERWEVQQAWDKQANFLKAQARAQGELRSMIKQYDELLNKNYELSTEEQKSRIALLKARTTATEMGINSEDDAKDQVKDWKEAIIEIAKRRSAADAGSDTTT